MNYLKLVAIFLCIWVISAQADPLNPADQKRCKAIEYAELKDMSQDELSRTYFETKRNELDYGQHSQLTRKFMLYAQSDGFSAMAKECNEQSQRISSVYQRRFNSEPSGYTIPPWNSKDGYVVVKQPTSTN